MAKEREKPPKKTGLIQVKVSEEEERIIETKANTLGLSLSAYLRFVALNAEINVNVNMGKSKK